LTKGKRIIAKILITLTLTGYLNFCRIVMDVKAKT